jgi:hypothetical protein
MMKIGIEKEEGTFGFARDWRLREIGFNRTDAGVLVIASVPTGKRRDVLMGTRCEIHLFPDGTYWGNVDANFVGFEHRRPGPRMPRSRDGCKLHPTCQGCPEKDCRA